MSVLRRKFALLGDYDLGKVQVFCSIPGFTTLYFYSSFELGINGLAIAAENQHYVVDVMSTSWQF
jgi:hypothetical protein